MEATTQDARLTRREIEVLSLMAEGHTNKTIADLLFVSKRTIDFHLANIYEKLKAHNRVQAIRAAARLGMLAGEAAAA